MAGILVWLSTNKSSLSTIPLLSAPESIPPCPGSITITLFLPEIPPITLNICKDKIL